MERSVLVRLRAEVAQFKSSMAESAAAVTAVGTASTVAGTKVTAAEASKVAAATAATRAAQMSETAIGRATLSAENNAKAWKTTGTVMVAAGALATFAVLGMMKAAIDWESAWAGVTKTVSGTPAQLLAIETGLRGLAKTLPSTHTEIAAVAEAAGQLGVATPYVVGFTKTMIALGETTNLSADEAATAIAQISNVMGTLKRDGTEGIERFGSALVALGNNGASTEREIVMMAQRIAASAALIGMNEAEVLGFANALASVGINVEAGGTAISKVMQEISKAVATGGEDLIGFAQVAGVSSSDFATSFREDPAEAITQFVEGLGRIKEEGGNVFAVLDELGMSDIRVSNALLTMANAGDLLRESIAMGNAAWGENTALMDEANKRYETTASKIEIAKNSIRDVAITMGDALLPAVSGAAEVFTAVTNSIGGLPEPLLRTAGGLLAVIGPLALVSGGFLLVFPRIMDGAKALQAIGLIGPKTSSALLGVAAAGGKMMGVALGLTAVVVALGALATATTSGRIVPQANAIEKALRDIGGSRTTTSLSGMNSLFSNMGTQLGLPITSANSLASAFDVLFSDDASARADRFGDAMTGWIPGVIGPAEALKEVFSGIDDQLVAMVNGGSADEARAALEKLFELGIEHGATVEQMNTLFSGTQDALLGVDEAASGADGSLGDVAVRMNGVTGEMEKLTEAQTKWLDSMGEADSSFIDFQGAIDTVIAKEQELAQKTADSTESATDSWETYYDGNTVSLDAWLAELEAQMSAQANWETNMILLSGRVSQGVLDELGRLGPEGAPLVAQLVTASDEELSRLEAVFGEKTQLATDSFAQTLMDAAPVIALASATLGETVAAEIAAKLASGELTIQQVLDEYNLVMPVSADTAPASIQVNGFIATVDESSGTLMIDGNPAFAVDTLAQLLSTVGESSEYITINGEPLPAETTLQQLIEKVLATDEPIIIGGDNTTGAAALAELLILVLGSGESISVDANTTAADATTSAWQPPKKTGRVDYSAYMTPWTPPTLYGTIRYTSVGAPLSMADGGYTGDGGKYEQAGIVHRGEWVTTKERTQDYMPILQSIHAGTYPKPSYWGGGPVGFSPQGYAEGGQVATGAQASSVTLSGMSIKSAGGGGLTRSDLDYLADRIGCIVVSGSTLIAGGVVRNFDTTQLRRAR